MTSAATSRTGRSVAKACARRTSSASSTLTAELRGGHARGLVHLSSRVSSVLGRGVLIRGPRRARAAEDARAATSASSTAPRTGRRSGSGRGRSTGRPRPPGSSRCASGRRRSSADARAQQPRRARGATVRRASSTRRSGSRTGRRVSNASQHGPSPRSNWISSTRSARASLANTVAVPNRVPERRDPDGGHGQCGEEGGQRSEPSGAACMADAAGRVVVHGRAPLSVGCPGGGSVARSTPGADPLPAPPTLVHAGRRRTNRMRSAARVTSRGRAPTARRRGSAQPTGR